MRMDKELHARIAEFRISMTVVKEMLSKGLIHEDEYAIICTVLASRYRLKSSTIFSDIDLICTGRDGNIGH